MTDLTSLRLSYTRAALSKGAMHADPAAQFSDWLAAALAHERLDEPYAFALATADAEGQPSVRTLLLRGVDAEGCPSFYTNYDSEKGRALSQNPRAEMLFYWDVLEQQVRVRGRVEPLDPQESTRYFHLRPRDSQLAAHVSAPQSGPVESREVLEGRFAALHEQFGGQDVPRPDFWGGYRLIPERWEFWQGRPNRMHDRLVYVRAGDGWTLERLMP
ncbi:pyridoxamine 5'-phosphate oxidase [Deinococcus radiophilus]|uniref:Pyridoxine/pyridoxamine 5'-phosphate oxidase n=1 Tax=Deinococcus radiophilus TaxID=32062 RepID=A0A431VYT2_9DEIO|nr:pyridoxamine 5'-phosphate oxidase [Deinococcus radiophilus]RTR28335.1 pyridoxamine 5'-phosphate oxidase [Deinococcus radiophilus]UFA51202.1 pyridoxamine 5'-phosphate oxidase [Deinococcus radiophilus]